MLEATEQEAERLQELEACTSSLDQSRTFDSSEPLAGFGSTSGNSCSLSFDNSHSGTIDRLYNSCDHCTFEEKAAEVVAHTGSNFE